MPWEWKEIAFYLQGWCRRSIQLSEEEIERYSNTLTYVNECNRAQGRKEEATSILEQLNKLVELAKQKETEDGNR